MEDTFREYLWKNFAATIDMLNNVIEMCPDDAIMLPFGHLSAYTTNMNS